jgi:hypothetical protein
MVLMCHACVSQSHICTMRHGTLQAEGPLLFVQAALAAGQQHHVTGHLPTGPPADVQAAMASVPSDIQQLVRRQGCACAKPLQYWQLLQLSQQDAGWQYAG